MGSLCGSNTQTTTQQSTNTPAGLAQLQDIYNRVSQVASTPYSPYGGQMTAGLTDTQNQGIAGITAAQGVASPYFNQAAQYATQGAAPISASDIQRYQSPYTQQVIDATKANFRQDNAIGQQQVIGNAAAKGALGGDRVGVAQAELARQQGLAQNPVIAGLENQGYTQALGAAQQDRAAAAQGAYTFGALAPSVQNAQISGAQAQIGAGGLQQGTNQADLTARYNQYLQAQAFPYQQAGFLASAGMPAVAGMGGTSTGQTTSPGPNPWAQIAGIGTAALMAKDGGRIRGYAGGGPVSLMDVPTYVPHFGGMQSASPYSSAPTLPALGKPADQSITPQQMSLFGKGLNAGANKLFGDDSNYDAAMAQTGPTFAGENYGAMGGVSFPIFNRGGRVGRFNRGGSVDRSDRFANTVHMIRQALRGGGVVNAPGGYADGGDVIDMSPADYVRQGFGDTQGAIDSGAFDPQGQNAPGPMVFVDPQQAPVPMPRPRPDDAPSSPMSLPPIMTAGMGQDPDALPDDASAFTRPRPSPYAVPTDGGPTTPISGMPASGDPSRKMGGLNLFNLSDDARLAIMSAGLGVAASKSPFALSAIGEGGQAGIKTYGDRLNHRQQVESQARQLAQQASQFAQNLGLHKDQLKETTRQHDLMAERENNKYIGTNEDGFPVYVDSRSGEETIGKTRLKTKAPTGYEYSKDGVLSPIKNGPADPEHIAAVAKAKGSSMEPSFTPKALDNLADQAIAGDKSYRQNLGRGAQGAANITALENRIAEKMEEKGMSGTQRAAVNARFAADTAAMRSAAVRESQISTAVEEARNTFPLALQRSAELPRGSWVPVNKAIQMVQAGTSSKELARFVTANEAVITAYAQAMSRTGATTVHAQERANRQLSTATSPEAYEAVIGQLEQEMQAAKHAPDSVRKMIMGSITSGHDPAKEPPPPSSISGAPAPKVGDRKQFKQGWGVWDGKAYVPEKP